MLLIHCDMEDCRASEPAPVENMHIMGGGVGVPKGWAQLEWQADGKGQASRQSAIMAKYFRTIAGSLPKRGLRDPEEDLRSVSEAIEAAPDALLTFRGYLCPACLGKIALGNFHVVNRSIVSPGLFG